MTLSYHYTNKLGRNKEIIIHLDTKDENGEYFNSIWDVATGEHCSSGRNSLKAISDFLDKYGVEHNELTTLEGRE